MPSHPSRQRDALETLLDKAGMQGYLSTNDLIEMFPDAARDSDRLRVLLSAMRRRGVDIFDPDEQDASRDPEADPASDEPLHTDRYFASDDPVGLYLKEMARVPLLSMEEELELAIRIERARNASKRPQDRSADAMEYRRRIEAILADGMEAREMLIKANTRLVVSIAKRFIGHGIPFLDMIQEGNLGLMKAVEKYDPHRGFRFSTYATWWIKQSITRAIADQARTIRVPVHMTERIRQLYKTQRELEQTLGRQPTIEEIAAALNLPVHKVQWILKVSWQPLSLESPVGDDDEAELGHFIEDDSNLTPVQNAYQSMLKDKMAQVLGDLSPRESQVLRWRFGLYDGHEYTLEEVGQKFGLTRERIRQIEGKALRHLRHPRRVRELEEYR
ncbi:MAG: sigma-70 family RNA polymerase sigma factor [Anaerolineaceae bacterium]|nr:MAG: sigma-70 family RNA polymerase sigma factor [Anaerolineaceae bacterium]